MPEAPRAPGAPRCRARFRLGLARRLEALNITLRVAKEPFWPEREIKTRDEVKKIETSLRAAEAGLLAGIEALTVDEDRSRRLAAPRRIEVHLGRSARRHRHHDPQARRDTGQNHLRGRRPGRRPPRDRPRPPARPLAHRDGHLPALSGHRILRRPHPDGGARPGEREAQGGLRPGRGGRSPRSSIDSRRRGRTEDPRRTSSLSSRRAASRRE